MDEFDDDDEPTHISVEAVNTLDDLPPHRRDALLWRYALVLDYVGVDDLVRARSSRSCLWHLGLDTSADTYTAVLGDDGRYHLHLAGKPRCADRSQGQGLPGKLWHEQWCYWWTDGTRYRVQAPPEAWQVDELRLVLGSRGERTVRWIVALTDITADPAKIPLRHRCPDQGGRSDWPGYQGSDTAIGRQRARLVAALGSHCHACRKRLGAVVDHDHFTGLVRGLLCLYCNSNIDRCPHASGCAWADYLNNPPARELRLRYPKPERVGQRDSDRQKIECLGFDPLYRGPQAERRRYPARSLPPPPRADGLNLASVETNALFEGY